MSLIAGVFTAVTGWLEASLGIAIGAAFIWGVCSVVLSPCHVASVPLAIGYVNGKGRILPKTALLLSMAFALGILVTIAIAGSVPLSAERVHQVWLLPAADLAFQRRLALDPSLARKYIPWYDEVFRAELPKTSVWLSSTRGGPVIDLVWQSVTRVIYQGVSVGDSVAALQHDIRALFAHP